MIIREATIEDAFEFYVSHFTETDKDFNDLLKPYLDEQQKKRLQRRYFELEN